MLTGLFVGIIAAFVWSITNLVDKYLVDKYATEGNIGGVLLFSCFFPTVLMLASLVVASNDILNLPKNEIATLIISGALMVTWIFFYLKALSIDDSSIVMTLLVLAPLFSLVFAQIILHEFLTTGQLMAGGLIVMGALTVTYEHRAMSFKWRLLGYALAASCTIGLMHSLFKFVSMEAGTWESLFWRSCGMVMVGGILYLLHPRFRSDFHVFVKSHFGKSVGLNLTNESLTLIGDVIFAFAISFTPLALVQTTEAYQPIFVFIMILIMNQLGYRVITENIKPEILIQKITGFVLVLGGTIALSIVS